MASDKAPDPAKQQEAEHRIPKSEMPDHGIAADVAGNNEPHHAGSEDPVEKARRQIPNADSKQWVGVHAETSKI